MQPKTLERALTSMDTVGGAADATVGGLTDANTVVGDFGTAATTAGETTGGHG